jgi:hypothetical protein
LGASVPTMSAAQIKKVDELYRSKYPYCEQCNARAVVSGHYIIGFNGTARLDLVCPNGHDLWHLLLEPEGVRSVGLNRG